LIFPLSVYRHLFASVTEEMGEALRFSAVSPNIKERLDFSCALLDATGRLVAHAAHIPVHLGSAHMTVPAVLKELDPGPGDIVILNDPHRGGTHLNDVTVVAPIFNRGRRLGFLLNRAHHADVGGVEPGSMGGASDLSEEGICLGPTWLARRGKLVQRTWDLFLGSVRDPESNYGDLQAQCAALYRGGERFSDLVRRFGAADVTLAIKELIDHGERLTEALLRSWPSGESAASDRLDGRGTPLLHCQAKLGRGRLRLDFSGTSPQVSGSWNTHRAVATSAVFYVLQSLSPDEIPETSGTLSRVILKLPKNSLVSSSAPAGVALGNVETSQRIVDVLLRALAGLLPEVVPASSQGTMNNLLFGGVRSDGSPFVHYETLGGGAGGGPAGPGASAVQVHMTNTRNTPVEVLESELPVRVKRLLLRRGSGGDGRHKGGNGMVKEIEFLAPARITVAASRRKHGPPGLKGGKAGKPGEDMATIAGESVNLDSGIPIDVAPGDTIRLATPGGGGWGRA